MSGVSGVFALSFQALLTSCEHGIPRISGAAEGEKNQEVEKGRIDAYLNLVRSVQKRQRDQDYSLDALEATSKLLARNPEYYTVWNQRRRIFTQLIRAQVRSARDLIASDLQFLVPLLVQYPKCYWIWNYRLWILHRMSGILDKSESSKIWDDELNLVSKMLTRDERNFHGWDYRRQVVKEIESLRDDNQPSLVESEFEYSTKMIRKALQNFSALHYRSKLIPRLLAERKFSPEHRRKFLEQELDLMQDALIDPFNQSAWFYHQFLMQTLSVTCPTAAMIVPDMSQTEREHYFKQEIERVRDILQDYDDCKWIYQALLQYNIQAPASARSTPADLARWLSDLQRLDPMRKRRWLDFERLL